MHSNSFLLIFRVASNSIAQISSKSEIQKLNLRSCFRSGGLSELDHLNLFCSTTKHKIYNISVADPNSNFATHDWCTSIGGIVLYSL